MNCTQPNPLQELAFLALSSRWLPTPNPSIKKVKTLDELKELFPETNVYQPVIFREPTYKNDFGLYLRPIKPSHNSKGEPYNITVFNSDKVAYDCWNCDGIVVDAPILQKEYGGISSECRQCNQPLPIRYKVIFEAIMKGKGRERITLS